MSGRFLSPFARPSRFISPRRVAPLALLAVTPAFFLPAPASADQTISTAVTGPVNGDNTAITVTSSGTISGGGDGVVATVSGTISTLTVAGQISVSGNGVNNNNGKIGLIDNSGLIQGTTRGILNFSGSPSIAAITNSGTISGGNAIETYFNIGSITNSGRIAGNTWGVYGSNTVGVVTNSGTISANAQAAYAAVGTTGTLSNTGLLSSGQSYPAAAVKVGNGGNAGTLTSFANSGSVTGFYGVLASNGTLASLTNSGTITAAMDGVLADSSGTVTSLVNQSAGRIEGVGQSGININGSFGTIDNSGTITGDYGIYGSGAIGTFINRSGGVLSGTGGGYGFYSTSTVGSFTNQAGGVVESTNYQAVYLYGDGVGTVTNAGVIRALDDQNYEGVYVGDDIVTFTNSGTISGYHGVVQDDLIGTLTNTATGLLAGTYSGLYVGSSYDMTVVNYGQIVGGEKGVYGYYDLGPLTNKSGGVISGTNVAGITIEDDGRTTQPTITNEAGALVTSANGAGVLVSASGYDPGTIVNAGRIEGATGGVQITGELKWVANTGTIAYTGAGTGPALVVGSGGVLGDATGASGPALTSTGSGALLAGTIQNQGTVHYGFTVDNQNVTVSAGGGAGTFTNGTLTVTDGDLTITNGQTTLGADISVNGGAGTVFNEGTLRLLGIENVTGNFQQSAGGTTLMGLLGTGSGQYGRLDMTGSALFAGTLALDDTGLTGGLVNGQIFQLFEFGTYSGGFSDLKVNGTSLTSVAGGVWGYGDLRLYERWTGTTMSLEVAAIPEIDPAGIASVLSLVVGSLGVAERRLRRGRRGARAAG